MVLVLVLEGTHLSSTSTSIALGAEYEYENAGISLVG